MLSAAVAASKILNCPDKIDLHITKFMIWTEFGEIEAIPQHFVEDAESCVDVLARDAGCYAPCVDVLTTHQPSIQGLTIGFHRKVLVIIPYAGVNDGPIGGSIWLQLCSLQSDNQDLSSD